MSIITDLYKRLFGTPATPTSGVSPCSTEDVQYRIHPPIGIARVGNASWDDFYIGPETIDLSGSEPDGTPCTSIKTAAGLIRKQGARFRIVEYRTDCKNGWYPFRIVSPGTPGVKEITWTVKVANTKSERWGGAKIEGSASASPVVAMYSRLEQVISVTRWSDNAAASKIGLGGITFDADGHLIVLGGDGEAYYAGSPKVLGSRPKIDDFFRNDGFYDDTSDGVVAAKVLLDDGKGVDALESRVIVGPPRYVRKLRGVVSLYDRLFDFFVRKASPPSRSQKIVYDIHGMNALELLDRKTRYVEHLKPILMATAGVGRVLSSALPYHSAYNSESGFSASLTTKPLRTRLRDHHGVRESSGPNHVKIHPERIAFEKSPPSGGSMPKLNGDGGPSAALAFPKTQLSWFLAVKTDDIVAPSGYPYKSRRATVKIPSGGDVGMYERLWAIDRGALDDCIGGAFAPGIEVSINVLDTDHFVEPFRPKKSVPVGEFNRFMAVPWHADFRDCNTSPGGYSWWPSHRPIQVAGADWDGGRDMEEVATEWSKLDEVM